MTDMTPSKAKKLARQALEDAGVPFRRLRARTVSISDIARESAVFVTPVGARLPDPRISKAKAALKGSGAILDLPLIVPAEGCVIE